MRREGTGKRGGSDREEKRKREERKGEKGVFHHTYWIYSTAVCLCTCIHTQHKHMSFVEVMLGCVGIKDHATQTFIVDFLDQLRALRNALLLQPGPL